MYPTWKVTTSSESREAVMEFEHTEAQGRKAVESGSYFPLNFRFPWAKPVEDLTIINRWKYTVLVTASRLIQ